MACSSRPAGRPRTRHPPRRWPRASEAHAAHPLSPSCRTPKYEVPRAASGRASKRQVDKTWAAASVTAPRPTMVGEAGLACTTRRGGEGLEGHPKLQVRGSDKAPRHVELPLSAWRFLPWPRAEILWPAHRAASLVLWVNGSPTHRPGVARPGCALVQQGRRANELDSGAIVADRCVGRFPQWEERVVGGFCGPTLEPAASLSPALRSFLASLRCAVSSDVIQ